MIHQSLRRPVPVELTDDPRIRRRVTRLAVVSLVALALIWLLAWTTLDVAPAIMAALVLGWVLMPLILAWSLAVPAARYLLVVPATLVSLGLLGICLGALPEDPIAAAGWILITGGVLLGGVLGLWLWFRVLPVPASLDAPTSGGRWLLIAIHVGLVVVGWTLASTALFL